MKEDEKVKTSEKKKMSRKQKILITSVALITGFSVTVVASSLIAYGAMFTRYERPDYSLYPGAYCIERTELSRDEFFIKSNNSQLKAYFYNAENSKGLIVLAHGYRAGADDYLPIISFCVKSGYSVFAYDVTGAHDSDGDSMVGWCQSLIDLDGVLTYISTNEKFNKYPLFLIGHSWGGYAVTSVLAIHKNVRACAGIAPMRDGSTIMTEKCEQYVGKLASVPKPIITAYQKLLFGNYVEHNGVRGINSVDIPVVIAQGQADDVITADGQSITAKKNEITNPNVIYYEGKGLQGGHDSIWHSTEAVMYQNEVAEWLKNLEKQKGSKLTEKEMVEFYKTIDHQLYSEVNRELMDLIIKTFDGANK